MDIGSGSVKPFRWINRQVFWFSGHIFVLVASDSFSTTYSLLALWKSIRPSDDEDRATEKMRRIRSKV